jgi:hypothetical protein
VGGHAPHLIRAEVLHLHHLRHAAFLRPARARPWGEARTAAAAAGSRQKFQFEKQKSLTRLTRRISISKVNPRVRETRVRDCATNSNALLFLVLLLVIDLCERGRVLRGMLTMHLLLYVMWIMISE